MKKIVLFSIVSANCFLIGCSGESALGISNYDTSAQLKKFHNGYLGQNLIGRNSCAGVYPQALLDSNTKSTTSKDMISSISWTGECSSGLMHGEGSLKIKPKEGSNVDYFYLTGNMNHGFFYGKVHFGYIKHNSSQIKNNGDLFVKLETYNDYVQYETPGAYNTNSKSSDDSSVDGALIAAASVALVGYGVYKLFGGGSDSSSSTSSSYSGDYSDYSSTEYENTSSNTNNNETSSSQNTSPSRPDTYDGGYKSPGGSTIYIVKCPSGSKYSAYQKSDGYWYDGAFNYGDNYKGLSLGEFAEKKCR